MRPDFLRWLRIAALFAVLFGSIGAPIWLLGGTATRSSAARVAAGSSLSVLRGAPLPQRVAAIPPVAAVPQNPAGLTAAATAPPHAPTRPRPVRQPRPALRPTPRPVDRASTPSPTPKPPPTSSTPTPTPAPTLEPSVHADTVVFQAATSEPTALHETQQNGGKATTSKAVQKAQPKAAPPKEKTGKHEQKPSAKNAGKEKNAGKDKGTDPGKAAGSDTAAGSQAPASDQHKGKAGQSDQQSKQDGHGDKSGGDAQNGHADKNADTNNDGTHDGHGKKESDAK
jgi:hypothetical protein